MLRVLFSPCKFEPPTERRGNSNDNPFLEHIRWRVGKFPLASMLREFKIPVALFPGLSRCRHHLHGQSEHSQEPHRPIIGRRVSCIWQWRISGPEKGTWKIEDDLIYWSERAGTRAERSLEPLLDLQAGYESRSLAIIADDSDATFQFHPRVQSVTHLHCRW